MDTRTLLTKCDNPIPGHGPVSSLKARLTSLVEQMDDEDDADIYGIGDYLQAFETEIASRFGKEAAVFMPSGTMAQQIALRIWCERRGNATVAMHPSAHPEYAEHLGYQYLHGIRRLQFGSPEMLAERTLTTEDFKSLGQMPGSALIELPYRPLGGVLPTWESVEAISQWAGSADVPLHLDGARIWQCADAYQKSHAEIAERFDSVYVSFYKDIGALCGAALIGSESFIAEARVWQRRHGGNLFSQAPFAVSARQQLAEVLPRLPDWNARAREIAARLDAHPRIRVHPCPPDVNFFVMHFEGKPDELQARHNELAERNGTFLFSALNPSNVPGFCRSELHCWENAAAADLDRLSEFVEALFAY